MYLWVKSIRKTIRLFRETSKIFNTANTSFKHLLCFNRNKQHRINLKHLIAIALIMLFAFYPLAEITIKLEKQQHPLYPYLLFITFTYIYILGYILVLVSKETEKYLNKK